MCNIKDKIMYAINNKGKIDVIYMDGSNPGTKQTLGPLQFVSRGDKVRARCYSTNVIKTFCLDKIKLPDEVKSKTVEYNEAIQGGISSSTFKSTQDIKLFLSKNFPDILYHVECDDTSFHVYPLFKNGNPRKTPVLALKFVGYEAAPLIFNEIREYKPDTNAKPVKRKRPWVLRHMCRKPITFATIGAAAWKIIELLC